MTTDLDYIETAVISTLRQVRGEGKTKSVVEVDNDSIKTYRVGEMIRIDIKDGNGIASPRM
jgi:hypothetical protein